MLRPGARNLITDIAGLRVGNAADARVRSGVTVVLADALCTAVVDVRGGAPGTRETEALDPVNLVGQADAIVLAGGSVHGLDAPAGVTSLLREQGRGFRMSEAAPSAPIVPAAILFDLVNGGDKAWGEESPYRALGRAAAEAAGLDFALGNAGVGLGARAGAYKGGLGSASSVTDDGFTIGAVVAVNSLGSPLIPGTDVFWTFPLEQAGEFGGRRLARDVAVDLDLPADMKGALAKQNTTIAVVAVDAEVSPRRAQAHRDHGGGWLRPRTASGPHAVRRRHRLRVRDRQARIGRAAAAASDAAGVDRGRHAGAGDRARCVRRRRRWAMKSYRDLF